VASAGNVEQDQWPDYPDSNTTTSVRDPAQSWNALTIGAFTNLVRMDAEAGEHVQLRLPGA